MVLSRAKGSRRTSALKLFVLTAVAVLVTGCAESSESSPDAPSRTLTVLAAASLTETFTTIARDFEATHPGVRVETAFGPSSNLASQISQGIKADVFASASAKTMARVVKTGDAMQPRTFATNSMQLIAPKDNPKRIAALKDLQRPGVTLALCQKGVPCGDAGAKVLANAGLNVKPVTLESDVKATLAKVRLGEVDAGIVYVTDARAAASDVIAVTIPDSVNVTTSYPIATLRSSADSELADEFQSYVLDQGKQTMEAAGFRPAEG